MLIIPVEQKPDWRRPPLVTLFLILINCLIFIFYQLPDDERIEKALSSYQESGLLEHEEELYLRHIRYEPWLRAALLESRDAGDTETIVVSLLHDLSFDEAVREQPGFEGSEWQAQRETIEEQRNAISYIGFGYKPSDPSIIDAITSMFLHGDFGHLFGNMLFLFIFGFGLEATLGRKAYLGIYLLTGFGATILYQLVEWNSFSYGVGASGAISGLMGSYLAVYGLKRIRFFMTVGFYFNNFSAPAAVVFPFWLGKELLYGLFGGDSVNQWAHAGGLISGFGLVYLMKMKGFVIQETALTEEEPENLETPYQKDRRQLESYMTDLQLFKAMSLCQQLIEKYPGDRYFLQTAWNLFEELPDHALYSPVVDSILSLPVTEGDSEFVARVYRNYRAAKNVLPECDETCCTLAERFLQPQWQKECTELVIHLTRKRYKAEQFGPVLRTLSRQMRNIDKEKSQYFKAYADKFIPEQAGKETVPA
ncbi:rhomboid family intramembrane serine protease [Parendozoicomonas haliclonae]|uniref:Rhomboid family protein n=1 Tax=Parendozoicomonas haliclonae TaxID=1960125 RepID=A0A1X7AJ31_9GAMM|nr:rhomboid family intramembrane serine protease [Parendozoicomonas haliclonae]SMA45305.1 Rhomboid family protein [Parendozoicomonas haliclonae]